MNEAGLESAALLAPTAIACSPEPGAEAGHARIALVALWTLLTANLRYWRLLAPEVRRQMRRWRREAAAIEDPRLRALALEKLEGESFNAEAAAIAVTRSPAAHRKLALEAVIAIEVMFDYLDGLTEQPLRDPLREGDLLYAPFLAALPGHPEAACPPGLGSGRSYANELARAARAAIAQLPGYEAIAPAARLCATRSAQAQIRMHAAPQLGSGQLQAWATEHGQDSGLAWREYLAASACSVLALHALIAAAADSGTTSTQAERLQAAYLPLCAAMTLLDGVVDRERDESTGQLSYAGLYEHPALLGQALASVARHARQACADLHHGAHHTMMLSGALAYWMTAPGARAVQDRQSLAPLRKELGAQLLAPLAVMRLWRALRSLRPARRRAAIDAAPTNRRSR